MVEESRLREGYKTTDLGIIPSDWEVVEVKEAYGIYNNLRLPISGKIRETMQGKYPYYGPTGIQDYINEYRLDGEYSLIGEDGDHFLKWRNMPMTLLVTGKFNVNNHAHVIKGLKNHTEWFYWYFYHRDITAHLSRQGAGRYKLNKRTLETLKMTIPSLPEQKAISETLMDSDKLILSCEKLIDKKKKIKLGAMQQLLTGKKRLPGFSGDWEIKKLGEMSRMQSGGTPRTEVKQFYNGKIPWASINDMTASRKYLRYTEKKITQEGLNNSSAVLFPEDTILYAMYASIGECVITKKEVSSSQAILGIQCYDQILCVEYLYYYLSFIKYFMRTQGQTGTQSNLNKNMVQNINITLPSIEEQKAIAQVLSDMDLEIKALEEKLEKYKTIKQGMMQELLTGRIRLI